jgi:hypothetical protein
MELHQLTDADKALWEPWEEFGQGCCNALIELLQKYGGLLLRAEPVLRPEGDAREVWQQLEPLGSALAFTAVRFEIAPVLQEIRMSAVLLRWLKKALEGEQLPDYLSELMFILWDDIGETFREAISANDWYRIVGDPNDLRFEVLELLTVAMLAVVTRPRRPRVEPLLPLCTNLLDLWSLGWPVLGVDSERCLVICCARS